MVYGVNNKAISKTIKRGKITLNKEQNYFYHLINSLMSGFVKIINYQVSPNFTSRIKGVQ